MGSRARVAWEVKYISCPHMVSVQLEEPFGSCTWSSFCPLGSRAGSLLLFTYTGTGTGMVQVLGHRVDVRELGRTEVSCRDLLCRGHVSEGCE